MQTLDDRFLGRLVKDPQMGCWLWPGARQRFGHGSIGVNGVNRGTHRLAYEMFCGPIPPGMCVCHQCDVPACCNPTHLFLGTRADNLADMRAKGRQNFVTGAKLKPPQVVEIRRRLARGERHRMLAEEFNVSIYLIGLIGRRKVWKNIFG